MNLRLTLSRGHLARLPLSSRYRAASPKLTFDAHDYVNGCFSTSRLLIRPGVQVSADSLAPGMYGTVRGEVPNPCQPTEVARK